MGKAVKIPEPTYRELTKEAEERDVSRGAIVEMWRQEANDE
jgi:hypothetical protein